MTAPRYVTDGGLETDLIFHHGVDLPEFAAFPLLDSDPGVALLEAYYDGYAEIARRAGAGLLLESPTWRANPDWGALVGYDRAALYRVNAASIELMQRLRDRYSDLDDVLVSGMVGPRGDGYVSAGPVDPDVAEAYHLPQLEAFADAGADQVAALTLTEIGEAIGIVRAGYTVGLPVAISFTVETDGRLPSGATLGDAIAAVDAAARPMHYLVNCAHPSHVALGLTAMGAERERIAGTRVNASTLSHAELDAAEDLDEGDVDELVAAQAQLNELLPNLSILGGCCGTDARHVAALWA